jgi:predicted ester cyclase
MDTLASSRLSRRQTLAGAATAAASALLASASRVAHAAEPATNASKLGYTKFPPVVMPEAWVEPSAPVGSVAYNEWLGRMFNGVLFNTADAAGQRRIASRIVHNDYLQHNLLVAQGRQGILNFMPVLFTAMPDARFILHDVFATPERVVTRWTWTGTLTGEGFLGVAPRGQRLEMDGIDVWTVRDGMLYEHWDQFDWPRAFAQLGVQGLPAPFYSVAAIPTSR